MKFTPNLQCKLGCQSKGKLNTAYNYSTKKTELMKVKFSMLIKLYNYLQNTIIFLFI